MQQTLQLKLHPSSTGENAIRAQVAQFINKPPEDISGFHIIKRSIDARGKQVWIIITLIAFINEPFHERTLINFDFKDVSKAQKKVIIIGGGPAGLFAALKLIEEGIKPIILERGKDVRARRRDLATLNKE